MTQAESVNTETPEEIGPGDVEDIDIHTRNVDNVVLPSEGRMLQHFCKLYIEFDDALSNYAPGECFNTDQKIAMYSIYCSVWGHKR